jgi:hypothetical protein
VLNARTTHSGDAMAAAIRAELTRIEKDVPVTVRPLTAYVDLSVARWRVAANALAVMGALGLLLALVGLYGLISHNVARRTAELGIRLALGASPRLLMRGVLKNGRVLVGSGRKPESPRVRKSDERPSDLRTFGRITGSRPPAVSEASPRSTC